MYFPWCGLFDQIRMADVFVHYDDVQLSRGFYNRVQVKTADGISWMSVPLKCKRQKQNIDQSKISYDHDWVSKHRFLAVIVSVNFPKSAFLTKSIQKNMKF